MKTAIHDEIESHAWQLLNSPDGFNGYSADEIKKWRHRRDFVTRNSVQVAICMARDEAWVRGRVRFSNGDFSKVESRIIRRLRDQRESAIKEITS
jgi:hypothetical protein